MSLPDHNSVKNNTKQENQLACGKENDGSDRKSEPTSARATTTKEDCMGCKLVTFVTPLVISSYLISQTTKSKVEQMPQAANWVGRNSWRKGAYRFAFNIAIPFGKLQLLINELCDATLVFTNYMSLHVLLLQYNFTSNNPTTSTVMTCY